MIQSILLFTLRPGVTDEQVEALLDGAMDLAIVAD